MADVRHRSSRRGIVKLVACAIAIWFVAPAAHAQPYPNRVIRIIHGFAPGGAADTLSRIMAEGLSRQLGQNVIVESKPGAGGNIASEAVARATPDGYTMGLITGGHAISGALYNSLGYKPVDSFEMISTVVYYALVVAVLSNAT